MLALLILPVIPNDSINITCFPNFLFFLCIEAGQCVHRFDYIEPDCFHGGQRQGVTKTTLYIFFNSPMACDTKVFLSQGMWRKCLLFSVFGCSYSTGADKMIANRAILTLTWTFDDSSQNTTKGRWNNSLSLKNGLLCLKPFKWRKYFKSSVVLYY